MNYEFSLILKEGTEITEELADELFEAGCDDSTPGTFCGTPCISFSREAESLELAIRSAVADVQKAGCVSSASRSNTTRRCFLSAVENNDGGIR
jgi:hypothetical protein